MASGILQALEGAHGQTGEQGRETEAGKRVVHISYKGMEELNIEG